MTRFLAALILVTLVMSSAEAREKFFNECGDAANACTVTELGDAKVTAFHCFGRCPNLQNRHDEFLDLVVLKEGDPGQCIDALPGETVRAFGWLTGGDNIAVTEGEVEYVRPTYPVGDRSRSKLVVYSTTPVDYGFSGGPLYGEDGRVVGMNYAKNVHPPPGASSLAVSEICRFLKLDPRPP